jgi:GTP-binding protein YchF
MKLGILGLPNVGKSTIFNAISKTHVETANYPFCTINPNISVVKVPDERLLFLKKIYNPKKITPTTIEFIDIAGLIKNASNGDGLGNKFLSHIRETDAIIHVVRCFDDKNITHVVGDIDPLRDIEIINTELILSDLEFILKKIEKLDKKKCNDKNLKLEMEFFIKIKSHLNSGNMVKNIKFNEYEKLLLKTLPLITSKPMLYVCNISEKDTKLNCNKYTKIVKNFAYNSNSIAIQICAKIEEYISSLSESDKKILLNEFELNNLTLDLLIKSGYNILNLITFFTAGTKEVKAWTIKNGTLAPQSAGLIHSDFEKGFICAEIINFKDLLKFGNEKNIKNLGLLKQEGKKYIIQDGDIIEFRFNV